MSSTIIKHVAVGLFASLATLSANAALVTLVGTSINYEYDDVANAGALSLFGTPTIIGDDVRFLPPSFRAESIDGAGTDLVTANFVFSRVYSTNGGQIQQLKVVEFGDYEITNGDAVSADLLLTAASNTNVFDFTSDSAEFDAAGDSSGKQTWMMMSLIDPSQAFIGASDDMAISIQNTLTATTNAFGETAWIQKKLTFAASTSVIPVPAAAWLFGSAIIGLAGIKRRK